MLHYYLWNFTLDLSLSSTFYQPEWQCVYTKTIFLFQAPYAAVSVATTKRKLFFGNRANGILLLSFDTTQGRSRDYWRQLRQLCKVSFNLFTECQIMQELKKSKLDNADLPREFQDWFVLKDLQTQVWLSKWFICFSSVSLRHFG